MRKVIDLQVEFGKTDITNIEFDPESRDKIPMLLIGLQYIHRIPPIREKVFEVLKQKVLKKAGKIDSRLKHSAFHPCINALQNHGLER